MKDEKNPQQLTNKTEKATWGGKELTDDQKERLKAIFSVIRDDLMTKKTNR